MATTKYTGYTSSNLPATVTTTPVSTPTPSPVVDATKIGTTATTTVPTPPALVVNPNQATQIANYTASSADTATSQEEQKLQAEADAQKARAQSQMTDLAQAQSALGGKAGDLATAYGAKDETGQSVNTLAAQLRQLNAQAQGLQLDTLAKQQAEMNKATGQNITQQAVTRNTADATRENLINMATIGIKSAIAKADYDTAKSYADQIVEAKYSGMEADLASKKTQLEWAMQQDLAPAQKKLADAQARQIKKQDAEIADKKAQEKQSRDMLIATSPYAPASITSKAQAIIDKGGSPVEVAIALGKYGGDYLGDLVKRSTIAKNQAEYDKTIGEIKKLNQPIQNIAPIGSNAYSTNSWVNSAQNKESLSAGEREKISKSFAVVGQLGNLATALQKDQTSFFGGKVREIKAALGQDADAGAIQAQITALVPQVARGTYGEVGVLTNPDVENYKKVIGNLSSPNAQNKAVTALTLVALRNGVKSQLDTAAASKLDVSRFVPMYQDLTNQINNINDEIGVTDVQVKDYMTKNPQTQQMIEALVLEGRKGSEILQILGVEN